MPRVDHAEDAELSAHLRERLAHRLRAALAEAGGWLPFDHFMAIALYEPGLGYYTRGRQVFGAMPQGGSDFVTAPELSPLFGATLARQVQQVLAASGTDTVYEFGAGSGALAEQVIDALAALGQPLQRYAIVDLSGTLRVRQRERLARFGDCVAWLDTWPERIEGFVLGNEVLDAMPVRLLHFDGNAWLERGVVAEGEGWAWDDRPSALHPPVAALGHFPAGSTIEQPTHALAFVRTLAERLARGAALFIDYGFPEAELYHPQRHMGTLMCHRAHRADGNPLVDVGEKDITAHVDFSAMALVAQEAGLEVLGYTSQARLLMNCGLLELTRQADLRAKAAVQKLLAEHEMGELFKALLIGRGVDIAPIGFAVGDRTHTL